jgi:hypothetical protein
MQCRSEDQLRSERGEGSPCGGKCAKKASLDLSCLVYVSRWEVGWRVGCWVSAGSGVGGDKGRFGRVNLIRHLIDTEGAS